MLDRDTINAEDKAARKAQKRIKDLPLPALLAEPIAVMSRGGLTVHSYSAEVFKASRSRPVLRYEITCFDELRQSLVVKEVFGKGYYRDDGAMTFDLMTQLWDQGFTDSEQFSIPEPIAYLDDLNLLLQGRASGDCLYDRIGNPSGGAHLSALAGLWLAKLHETNLARVPPLGADYEQTRLQDYLDGLTTACPAFSVRIVHVVREVMSRLKRAAPARLAASHGDFQPKNICFEEHRITVLDLDRIRMAHPARDLGQFIGQSMTMSYIRTGSFKEIEPWNRAFLDGYLSSAPDRVSLALPVFVVRTFLEVMYHRLVVFPMKETSFVGDWLDECERLLVERTSVLPEDRQNAAWAGRIPEETDGNNAKVLEMRHRG